MYTNALIQGLDLQRFTSAHYRIVRDNALLQNLYSFGFLAKGLRLGYGCLINQKVVEKYI